MSPAVTVGSAVGPGEDEVAGMTDADSRVAFAGASGTVDGAVGNRGAGNGTPDAENGASGNCGTAAGIGGVGLFTGGRPTGIAPRTGVPPGSEGTPAGNAPPEISEPESGEPAIPDEGTDGSAGAGMS